MVLLQYLIKARSQIGKYEVVSYKHASVVRFLHNEKLNMILFDILHALWR